jgi:hypothetical protein
MCISSNSAGSKKLPDDGRLLPKHVGASLWIKEWYNQCILLVISATSNMNGTIIKLILTWYSKVKKGQDWFFFPFVHDNLVFGETWLIKEYFFKSNHVIIFNFFFT